MQGERALNFGTSAAAEEQRLRDIAVEAYIFGYPLVLMDVTRRVSTNVLRADENAAPLNRFANRRTFPDSTFSTVVSPNADTLYTFAFLELREEAMLLSVPEMMGRYYIMQLLDGWTEVFASLGTRTTGATRNQFAIAGPRWSGELPSDVQEVRSSTSMVWIIGRTQTNGKDDYEAVHALQDQYGLVPLSSVGKPGQPIVDSQVDPGLDMKTPPVVQVARMNMSTFFSRLNFLMVDNPPSAADAEILERLKTIGVAPGLHFHLENMDRSVVAAVKNCVRDAQERIISEARKPHGRLVNGWQCLTTLGHYGTNYLWRAVVALIGLGANLPEDAVYLRATQDSSGKEFNGAHAYEIRFAKGQLPPVNAFWSITMYNERQLFVPNVLNRYAIGDRDRIEFNSDGSLSILIQNERPGKDKEANWLPCPPGSFNLTMRLYWPQRAVIEGRWQPPKVERKRAKVQEVV